MPTIGTDAFVSVPEYGMPNLKRKLYVKHDRVSAQYSEGAIAISFSGPTPDYLVRVNLPAGPRYFADKTEAAQYMGPNGPHDVSLLPVDVKQADSTWFGGSRNRG